MKNHFHKPVVHMPLMTAIFFCIALATNQVWAACEPQFNAQCEGEEMDRLDWHRTDLEGGNFRNADLKHINLSDANLQFARLQRSDLAGWQDLQDTIDRQMQPPRIRLN